MSEDDQHTNKRSTGTVPKQRIRYAHSAADVDRLRSLSNSSSDYYHDPYNELRSLGRSNQIIDSTPHIQGISPVHIGSINLNSVGSSNPSSTASRKNSLGPSLKCDNIKKYPNKGQLEDKLNQIHEYLKVTNSLMASIKKVDNQALAQHEELMVESDISSKRNDGNSNLENLGLNLISFKEHDGPALLQRKTENKCLSPRQNRSNLLLEVCNHMNSTSNRNDVHYDSGYKECEEKNRKFHPHPQLIPTQDKSMINMEGLHNHILGNNVIDDGDLYDILDSEDAGLTIQHEELHKKIVELQKTKSQIAQFIAQLQSSEANGEDVEHQMMKICAMKAQLKKLKNMLEIVKSPLNMENSNNSPDYEKTGCYLCYTGENIKTKVKSRHHNDSNLFRSASSSVNSSRIKQLNKNSMDKSKLQPTKTNMSSNAQKSTLRTELELKKRELVEIMEKHRVNPSNLNQDHGIDTKSDLSFLMNGFNDPWAPVMSHDSDSDRFSSDDYQNDINEDVKHNFLLPSPSKFSSSVSNSQSENLQREFRSANRRSYTPEANYRSSSNVSAIHKNKPQVQSLPDLHTNQIQKQLEIIRNMCDSMLQHQNNQDMYSNQQHVQNNEIHANSSRNSDSGINSDIQSQWFPPASNNLRQDSYYNSLNPNNAHTQSFMLNSLNQCYEMLWMQQKEIANLKNNVSMLQERLKNNHFETSANHTLPGNSQTSPNRHLQHQPDLEHKINQDAYSIPVNGQFEHPLSGIYFNSVNNSNGPQLLDSCLNNINLNHMNVEQNAEVIQGNMNHLMPNHIWSGQALNNQVVPGNRANNYWDNFRSYSRQNLLSTKNSEVLQNLPNIVDRPNFINQCANPFAFISFSKRNSEQDANSSHENTLQRMAFKESNPGINSGTQPIATLANNDNVKNNEEVESPSKDIIFHKDNNSQFGLPLLPHIRTNIEERPGGQKSLPIMSNIPDLPKSAAKESHFVQFTFEDMKENIYKEVAFLISANENRPQFLMQLFKDLQLIKSDNVRENVLHSIERNVFNSHGSAAVLNSESPNQSTYLPSTSSLAYNTPPCAPNIDNNSHHKMVQEIQLNLNRHDNDIVVHNNFLISLKEFLMSLASFKETFKDKTVRISLINVLDKDLQRFCGQKLKDIKTQLIQRINDLLLEHRLFHVIEESHSINNELEACIISSNVQVNKTSGNVSAEAGQIPTNGDLAEADQSQSIDEDFAEEGAVGGVLDSSQINITETSQIFEGVLVGAHNQVTSEHEHIGSVSPTEEDDLGVQY